MRTCLQFTIILLLLPVATLRASAAGKPLALHPDNPRYFLFRGKPAVLITSGEHYGAVLNRDFDYVAYPALRKQLQILKEFMDGLDFLTMRSDNSVLKGGHIIAPLAGDPPEAKATARALVAPGRTYAIYVRGGRQATLEMTMPAGKYRAEWINTKTGAVDKAKDFEHGGGTRTLASPAYQEDIALHVRASKRSR